jgi:predicted phosphodiesterase
MVASLEEYRRLAAKVARELEGDERATRLARDIAALARFEAEHELAERDRLAARLGAASHLPGGRRTAIISDIHGNHAGLLAALDDIARQGCDRIVCLGDLVEGGPADDAVVEEIRSRQIPCVRGNHDENSDVVLADASRAFLAALPARFVEGDVLYVHISPRAVARKLNHEVEAWNVFDETAFRLVFVGHVHVPYVFGQRSAVHGQATRHAFEYNRPFALEGDRYIVSVGSIGYGRDRVGKIRYAIHDRASDTVELRAIEGPLLPLDTALRERLDQVQP